MIRHTVKDGNIYFCADDLANAILLISEDLAADTHLTPEQRHITSYVTERLAMSILGANLNGIDLVVGDDFAP